MNKVSKEQRLLEQARNFNSQVLAKIYDDYSQGIYRYAMRRLGDRDLAEDCVAETFSRFLSAVHRKRGPRNHLQAYLYRIAHNWIIDHFRSTKPEEELVDSIPSGQENPETDAAGRLQKAEIRAAIHELTPDQQQVIVLKYLEGWENGEIAQALRKPVGAVKSLQHRALGALKKRMQNEEQA
jgi:RNA polymerase sigma-70 factor (ECF subfamily)